MTLTREQFAAAALTGLLARPQWSPSECVPEAYKLADAMLAECEQPQEDHGMLHTFKPGCEVTNEPVEVIVARLKKLADDERVWRMPAKFQWTMLQAAWLLERLS